MAQTLFRTEAVQHQQTAPFGQVSLAQPRYFLFWVLVFALLLAILLGFALFSDMARKERVRGILVPSKGVIHITSDRAGRVEKIFVDQGQKVSADTRLVQIVSPRQGNKLLGRTVIHELNQQLEETEASITEQSSVLAIELRQIEARKQLLQQQLGAVNDEHQLLQRRITIHTEKLHALRRLGSRGPISHLELIEAEDAVLRLNQLAEQLSQRVLELKGQYQANLNRAERIPIEHAEKIRSLKRVRSTALIQVAETRALHHSTIRAPVEAKVSSLQATPDQQLSVGDPIASLIAEESKLLAHLFLPPGSAGLVAVGDAVLLRLDAFPYQKFGQVKAEVIEIDGSLRRPDPHLDVSADGTYLVLASIEEQGIESAGEFLPFKAGMLLEADILLERRRLIDWLLEPLLGFKVRFQ